MAKAAAKKPPTKTEVYASISESTGVAKKDVGAVFDALVDEISKALSKKGSQSLHAARPVQDRRPAQAGPTGQARTCRTRSSQAS